ncbi:MAG: hypothetical protein LBB67_04935 [Oscillospiraceae bacterium]|jgi:hypothetical protein|nr:hypothetical protein [Oscillospiraceae bacterium]
MAKIKIGIPAVDEEKNRKEQELQAQRLQVEQEKARLQQLSEQRAANEHNIMRLLVEDDQEPRALEEVSAVALEVGEWYLRLMVVERLGRQILLGGDYTPEELQEWLIPYAVGDPNTYVRRAAIKHLTNIPALARASSADPESVVRKKAVEQLKLYIDQPEALTALGEVAMGDDEAFLRSLALAPLTDQIVIATVAKTDAVPEIRKEATQKLTEQEDLAWLMIKDETELVRAAAGELLTDITAVAKVTAALKAAQSEPSVTPEEIDEALDDLEKSLAD